MKTDAEIAREVASLAPIVGPTHADWYGEASSIDPDGISPEGAIWACRTREAVLIHGRNMGELVAAVEKLLDACYGLPEHGGKEVRLAAESVHEALWFLD